MTDLATPSAHMTSEFTNPNLDVLFSQEQIQARIKDLGAEPMPMSSDDFGKLVQSETDKWAKVVKSTGLPQIQ